MEANTCANPGCRSRSVARISGQFKHPTSKKKLPSKGGLNGDLGDFSEFWKNKALIPKTVNISLKNVIAGLQEAVAHLTKYL